MPWLVVIDCLHAHQAPACCVLARGSEETAFGLGFRKYGRAVGRRPSVRCAFVRHPSFAGPQHQTRGHGSTTCTPAGAERGIGLIWSIDRFTFRFVEAKSIDWFDRSIRSILNHPAGPPDAHTPAPIVLEDADTPPPTPSPMRTERTRHGAMAIDSGTQRDTTNLRYGSTCSVWLLDGCPEPLIRRLRTLAPLSHNYQSAYSISWCPCSCWSRWAPTEGGPRAT